MTVKREYFEDFINDLFHIELKIIENYKPKLHPSEQDLFDNIFKQITENGIYLEDKDSDKRIKNRLKNKISDVLSKNDIIQNDKELRKKLSTDISFYNINEFKKVVRKIVKRNTSIENIHTFLLVLDELRNFFYKVKEQNEIKQFYVLLEENLPLIDCNLSASYFLRELDLDLSKDSLNKVEGKIRRLELIVNNDLLIDGYKFRLSRILCQHKINTGEWEDATKVAKKMEENFVNGKFYSRENISKLYVLFIQIYNQTYEKEKFQYYLDELGKSESETGFIEKQILGLSAKMNTGNGFISKEMLSQAEKLALNSDSERISTFLRYVRTQHHINNLEFDKAKSYNDIFFIDIYNFQVREFLDTIYIQRFIILFQTKKYEEIVILFENKITQRRILSVEKKGKKMILLYVIYDLARYKQKKQSLDETYNNIYRILDYYQYSNFLTCYNSIKDAILLVFSSLKLDNKKELKLKQLNQIIEDTINRV